ncbi:heat shock protein HtpX [compost metagenome]
MKRWLAIAPLLWPALVIGLGDLYALTHYHLSCLIAPQWTVRSLGIVVLVAANLLLALSMAWQIGRTAAITRRLRRLDRLESVHRERLALPELDGVEIRVIPEDVPMLFTVGGWRSVIGVSRWMLDHLDPAELRAAFAHELAHVQHRDGFLMLLLRGLCPWGFGVKGLRSGLEGVAHALELRADAIAASRVADPLAVASALVKVGRASQSWRPAMAFADPSMRLKERVAALMDGAAPPQPPRFWEQPVWMAWGLLSLAAWLGFVGHLCVRGLV